MYLKITEEMKTQIEKWWNKPLNELTDVDAVTIVEEFARVDNVKNAWFSTEDEIYYEFEEEEEEAGDIFLDIWLDCKRAKYLGLD